MRAARSVAVAVAASFGLAGCQLIVEFDRSRLEPPEDARDASVEAGPRAEADADAGSIADRDAGSRTDVKEDTHG